MSVRVYHESKYCRFTQIYLQCFIIWVTSESVWTNHCEGIIQSVWVRWKCTASAGASAAYCTALKATSCGADSCRSVPHNFICNSCELAFVRWHGNFLHSHIFIFRHWHDNFGKIMPHQLRMAAVDSLLHLNTHALVGTHSHWCLWTNVWMHFLQMFLFCESFSCADWLIGSEMAVRLSALRTSRALLPRNIIIFFLCLWYSFLLEAEWAPGSSAAGRIRWI
jgi:hypothetical protein